MRYASYAALLLGLLWWSAACGQTQDLAELELDHAVDTQFVTPHTPWATPYALGTTRALFFVNGRDANARETIELKQRFDLDAQMVFWARIVDTSRDDWHGGANGVRRMARLLSQPWDVFVFMGVSPQRMPLEQQHSLARAVSGGAGLVVLGAADSLALEDRNRLKELPAFLGDVPRATAYAIGNGRGVRIPKSPEIPYRPGWEVTYDEWDMRLGKAILWAAGKQPKLVLAVAPRGGELPRTGLPGPAAALRWQGAGARTMAELTLRRDDGAVVRTWQYSMPGREGSLTIDIPAVRVGEYVLDAVAREGGKVVSFASAPLVVGGPRRVTGIELTQDWAEVGQSLGGEVALSGPPGAGEQLVVSLFDRRHRELARQTLVPRAPPLTFRFEVQPWFPMLLEVRATLREGPDEVASAWQFANVVRRRRDRFNFVMWDVPTGNLAPYAEESLARTGVTVQLGRGTPPPCAAAYDIAWIPYATRISAEKDGQGIMKPACWNDEVAIQAHVDSIVAGCVAARRHGVFAYSLGDETVVRGSCLSPHCLEAYRAYLQQQYGDIAALNASWGSRYGSFADVQLGRRDDNDEAQALRAGNFPRWFDRQAFQSYNFCRLCERFGRAFRRIDPESRSGFEGAGTFGQADDLDGFVRSNGFWSPYPGTADEVLRSIAPRDFPRSNWMGYTKDADSLLEKYWRMVTRGCDGVWWWRWEVMGRYHGWLAPTLDPYPAVREILRDTQIVRDGLGDLLLRSEMQTDSVGVLYSQPSAYAAKIQSSPSYGSYEGNHQALHDALRDLGLNFLYFTDRQMRQGEVDLGRFKVVILPMAQALGAPEAEQVRRYVREGGVLIADIRPGVYDGHVKPLAAGQLDDVFGVRRSGLGPAATATGLVRMPAAVGEAPVTLAQVRADPGVRPAGATAAGSAGQAPLFLTHSFGQGQAVLLNLAMASYPAPGTGVPAEPAARLWRETLALGHVRPALELGAADGEPVHHLEVTRWVNGPVQIVSLFQHAGAGGPVTLRLPQAMHAYDLKNRSDLGSATEFRLPVTPHRACLYALSREPIGPVSVETTPAVAPGSVQSVRIASALPQGQQAVKVQVELPDGRLADWVEPVAVVDRGGAAYQVPVAFNDPSGTWTLRATELYTGRTSTVRFDVK